MATKKSDAKTPKPQPKSRAPAEPKSAAATATPAPGADTATPPAPPAALKPDFVPNHPSEPFIPNTTRHARLLTNALEWASSACGTVVPSGFHDALLLHALGPEIDRVPGEVRVNLLATASAPRGFKLVRQIAGLGALTYLNQRAEWALGTHHVDASWCLVFDTWLFVPGAELPMHIEFAIEQNSAAGVLKAYVPTAGATAEEAPLGYAQQIASALIHVLAGGGRLQGFESEATATLLRQLDTVRDL